MQNILTCLWFDGQAKAAAEFYCSVFENSKITADTPMVVSFEIKGRKFIGLNGGPQFKINPSVSFFVNCAAADEVETKWKKLSEGGMVMMQLDKYPWSEKYGWCQDKFGVNWQLMTGKMEDEAIVPALMFTQQRSGKAEEAMKFYTSVFSKKNGSPMDSGIRMISRYEKGEPDVEGYIKHAQFTLNGQLFVAMDSSAPHAFTFNEAISFVVNCDSQQEIDYFWQKLIADGGQESMCGWLKDKFGLSWQIIPENIGRLINDPVKGGRAMQEMLKMKKIVVEKLENA